MNSKPRPPIFQDTPFARALERSSADGLWLVVSVTSQVDAVCKAMDDATWRDTEVCEWIERKALAVQIDIDKDRQVARALNARAVPTTIVFRSGKHEERIAGFQDATETSTWLSSLEKRQTRPDGNLRESSAEMALRDRRYDEATNGYVWLWNNIPGFDEGSTWFGSGRMLHTGQNETAWMRVQSSKEIESLVKSYVPAHEAFGAIRDASGAAARAFDLTEWFGPRVDWILLNQVLGQQDRTIEWFNGVKDDARYAPVVQHCATLLLEPLKDAQSWPDIGRLFVDPLATLAEVHELLVSGTPQDQTADLRRFREEVVVLYAGLRAAGRAGDAKAVRNEALRLDPSDEMRKALDLRHQ